MARENWNTCPSVSLYAKNSTATGLHDNKLETNYLNHRKGSWDFSLKLILQETKEMVTLKKIHFVNKNNFKEENVYATFRESSASLII